MDPARTGRRAVALAVLIALLGAPALAVDPPAGPPGAKAPPAVPVDSEAEVEAVRAMLDRGEWARAASRADAVLARTPSTPHRFVLRYQSAIGHCYSRGFVGCLVRTEQILREVERYRWPGEPWVDHTRELRAEALLGLGREEEAGRALRSIRERNPTLESQERARTLEAVLRSSGPVSHDTVYEGKFRSDPGLAKGMEASAESLRKAMERVRWWLQEPALPFPPLVLRFGDDDWSAEGAAAWATGVARGESTVGVITFDVDCVLHGAWRDRGILAHELAHVLREAGAPGTGAASWLEEGLAHWISADLDEELPDYVFAWRVCPLHFAPGAPADSLPAASIPDTEAAVAALGRSEQRLCGVLFFSHVERNFGLGATRALALALLRAPDPSAVIAERLGKSPDDLFAVISRRFSLEPYEGRDLADIRSLLRQGSWAEAEAKCREFCKGRPAGYPGHRFVPVARRDLYAALLGQGKGEEARRVLEEAIEEHGYSPAHPWLLLEALRLARRDGDSSRVASLGREIQAERSMLDDAAREEVKAALREAGAVPARPVPPAEPER